MNLVLMALNDAHSILSLIYYRGYDEHGREFPPGKATKNDVDRALRAVINAEKSLSEAPR